MLFILLISLALLLVVFYLITIYWRDQKSTKQVTTKLTDTETQLIAARNSVRELQGEISLLQNKLHHTFEDPVTKLLGWQLFEDRLAHSIHESERYHFTLGLLFVDIDDFKTINNAMGYEFGDEVLHEVAKRLHDCIRQVDSISRFTKDTFVILLAQLAKPETAAVVAQRILQALAKAIYIKEKEIYLTACIGIATYPTDGQDPTGLLRSADHALHLAKEKGHQLYQFYQQEMHQKSQRELLIYTGLNRESITQEFACFYQPIRQITSKNIFAMDAQLFWEHPDLNLISPEELINYAEKQRKLNFITEWLLRQACKQYLHWQAFNFTPTLLGIPVAMKQLENSHFIYRLSQIIQESGIKPAALLFEIQKCPMTAPDDNIHKALNMLKYMGVNIALDHFGTNAFSLEELNMFDVGYLKLDKALIINITENEQIKILLKCILFLARSLSMKVLVPGVDTDEQLTLLQEFGYEYLQGEAIGPALSEEEVERKMGTHCIKI